MIWGSLDQTVVLMEIKVPRGTLFAPGVKAVVSEALREKVEGYDPRDTRVLGVYQL